MKDNIFIVAGPLHIMNSIEAVKYFKTKNNILLVLYTDNSMQLAQMKKLLAFNFIIWKKIQYIPLPKTPKDKFFFTKQIETQFQDITKSRVDKIFVGEYRSDHVNHMVNFLNSEDIYLLDDGLAQLNYKKQFKNIPIKVKIRRVIYKLLSYKLKKINYTFFTIFDIEERRVIKHQFEFFHSNIKTKKIKNTIYFIGQPLVELGIVDRKNYKNMLGYIIDSYKNLKFIYILHRRENINNIKKLSVELDFEYKILENLIELEMIQSSTIPSHFATFYSTAIVTLPYFLSNLEYKVFKIDKKIIPKSFQNSIDDTYKALENIGLKSEML